MIHKIIHLQIEKLPEGYYLATSEDIQGLVAQGKTLSETLAIAQDLAEKLSVAQSEVVAHLPTLTSEFKYPLVISV